MGNPIKSGLRRRDKYYTLQYNVAQYNPLSGQLPDQLHYELREMIGIQDEITPYATLLLYNLLLKSGNHFRLQKQEFYGELSRLAKGRSNVSAAASWILARIYANDMANEPTTYRKLWMLNESHTLISKINEPIQYKHRILLPGIKSESLPDNFHEDNGFTDPTVKILPVPYRYLAGYSINLASFYFKANPGKAKGLIEQARKYCLESERKHGIHHPFLSLNILLAKSVIDTTLSVQTKDRKGRKQLLDSYFSYIKRIDEYLGNNQLEERKASEWKCTCYAGIASLSSDSARRHEDYLRLLNEQASKLVSTSNGGVDFFEVDYIYKLALFNEEEKREFNKATTFFINSRLATNNHSYGNTNAFNEALLKVHEMKHSIEDKDGYIIFSEGKNLEKKAQYLFSTFTQNSDYVFDREVNNGRGPVDYKVSKGRHDMALVEFKLASSSKLSQNLENQIRIYEKANNVKNTIIVILYFSDAQKRKVQKKLKELGMESRQSIILVNCEKPIAASKAKSR